MSTVHSIQFLQYLNMSFSFLVCKVSQFSITVVLLAKTTYQFCCSTVGNIFTKLTSKVSILLWWLRCCNWTYEDKFVKTSFLAAAVAVCSEKRKLFQESQHVQWNDLTLKKHFTYTPEGNTKFMFLFFSSEWEWVLSHTILRMPT
jgi:hypothetical protein